MNGKTDEEDPPNAVTINLPWFRPPKITLAEACKSMTTEYEQFLRENGVPSDEMLKRRFTL